MRRMVRVASTLQPMPRALAGGNSTPNPWACRSVRRLVASVTVHMLYGRRACTKPLRRRSAWLGSQSSESRLSAFHCWRQRILPSQREASAFKTRRPLEAAGRSLERAPGSPMMNSCDIASWRRSRGRSLCAPLNFLAGRVQVPRAGCALRAQSIRPNGACSPVIVHRRIQQRPSVGAVLKCHGHD